jgi:hypothetical protein
MGPALFQEPGLGSPRPVAGNIGDTVPLGDFQKLLLFIQSVHRTLKT